MFRRALHRGLVFFASGFISVGKAAFDNLDRAFLDVFATADSHIVAQG